MHHHISMLPCERRLLTFGFWTPTWVSVILSNSHLKIFKWEHFRDEPTHGQTAGIAVTVFSSGNLACVTMQENHSPEN
ncbi:hypothetical protein J5N97_015448 [Dioscorea zingiberensis]|uniref:Uncharacterized protein n=1 Tax=Dioscorea zingiberensis TaxID=325984 RepID=A0A9D5CVR3_9LILI|nr:hypothetical protein J5N97_015448 [Dioscorea zingiberensis]